MLGTLLHSQRPLSCFLFLFLSSFLSSCYLQLPDNCTFTHFSIPFTLFQFLPLICCFLFSSHPSHIMPPCLCYFHFCVFCPFLVAISCLQIILHLLCQDLLILFPSLLHSLSRLPLPPPRLQKHSTQKKPFPAVEYKVLMPQQS